jgi:hypothetical protein
VTILHRGNHEVPEISDDVEHIHVDPHFMETLAGGPDPQLRRRRYTLRQVAEIIPDEVAWNGEILSAPGRSRRDVRPAAKGQGPADIDAFPSAVLYTTCR